MRTHQSQEKYIKEVKEHYPGWANLIDEINEYILEFDPNYEIRQIKEKFGGLRYYFSFSSNMKEISMAEISDKVLTLADKSYTICEKCSSTENVENTADNYWLKTLCNKCRKERYIR